MPPPQAFSARARLKRTAPAGGPIGSVKVLGARGTQLEDGEALDWRKVRPLVTRHSREASVFQAELFPEQLHFLFEAFILRAEPHPRAEMAGGPPSSRGQRNGGKRDRVKHRRSRMLRQGPPQKTTIKVACTRFYQVHS